MLSEIGTGKLTLEFRAVQQFTARPGKANEEECPSRTGGKGTRSLREGEDA